MAQSNREFSDDRDFLNSNDLFCTSRLCLMMASLGSLDISLEAGFDDLLFGIQRYFEHGFHGWFFDSLNALKLDGLGL
ncbi:unnamed protein product [Rhizophagus irregularis]|nr:unnamed protein product [Rhizophagus irregularis]